MPLDLCWNCNSGVRLLRWHITENREQLAQSYNQIWGDLANPETAAAGNTHKLAARHLIAHAFPQHQLVFSQHGKPLLKPPSAHINHSHAGEFALLAHHPKKSVGVDLEQLRPQLARIYPRFCNEKELTKLGPDPNLETLLLIWCAKEALYKAIGQKGTDFSEHLHLSAWPTDTNITEGTMEANITLTDFEQTCTLQFLRWDGYAVVWVALG